MSRFGIRNKLKSLVKTVVGGERAATSADPPPAPVARPEPSVATPVAPPAASKPTAGAASKPAEASAPASAPPPPTAAKSEPQDPGAGSTWVHIKRVKADEMADGTIRRIDVFGQRMALAFVDGTFYATQGSCPHGPGQLGDGDLAGHIVTCPVHGLEFDVRDGSCTSDPDMEAPSIDVRVKDNKVLVMVEI